MQEAATSWLVRGMMVTGGHALVSFMLLHEAATVGMSNGLIVLWTLSFIAQQMFMVRIGNEADRIW